MIDVNEIINAAIEASNEGVGISVDLSPGEVVSQEILDLINEKAFDLFIPIKYVVKDPPTGLYVKAGWAALDN